MSPLLFVRGTMWAATLAWAIGEIGMRRFPHASRGVRAIWTVGVALAFVHTSLAFHHVHGWSHSAAALETMRQAEERFGVGWSGGIYVNYVFLGTWLLDAGWWWFAAQSRAARARGIEAARVAFFVFMFVNGAIVFASGLGRLVGIACVGAVLLERLARVSRFRKS